MPNLIWNIPSPILIQSSQFNPKFQCKATEDWAGSLYHLSYFSGIMIPFWGNHLRESLFAMIGQNTFFANFVLLENLAHKSKSKSCQSHGCGTAYAISNSREHSHRSRFLASMCFDSRYHLAQNKKLLNVEHPEILLPSLPSLTS